MNVVRATKQITIKTIKSSIYLKQYHFTVSKGYYDLLQVNNGCVPCIALNTGPKIGSPHAIV